MTRTMRDILYSHILAILGIVAFTVISIHGATSLRSAGISGSGIPIHDGILGRGPIMTLGLFLFASSYSVLATFLIVSTIAVLLSMAGAAIRLRGDGDSTQLRFSWLPSLLTIAVMGSVIPGYSRFTAAFAGESGGFSGGEGQFVNWIGARITTLPYQMPIALVAVAIILLLSLLWEKLKPSVAPAPPILQDGTQPVDSEITTMAASGHPFFYRETQTPERDVLLHLYGWIVFLLSCVYFLEWCSFMDAGIPILMVFVPIAFLLAPTIIRRFRGVSITVIPENLVVSDRFIGHSLADIPIGDIREIEFGRVSWLTSQGEWKQSMARVFWDTRGLYGYGSRSAVKVTTADKGQYIILSNDPRKLANVLRCMIEAADERLRLGVKAPIAGVIAKERRKEDRSSWGCLATVGIILALGVLALFLDPRGTSVLSLLFGISIYVFAAVWLIKDLLDRAYPESVGKWSGDIFWGTVIGIYAAITTYLTPSAKPVEGWSHHDYILSDVLLWACAGLIGMRVLVRKMRTEKTADLAVAVIVSIVALLGLFPNLLRSVIDGISVDQIRAVDGGLLIVAMVFWTSMCDFKTNSSTSDSIQKLALLLCSTAVTAYVTYLRCQEIFGPAHHHWDILDIVIFFGLWIYVVALWDCYRKSVRGDAQEDDLKSESDA